MTPGYDGDTWIDEFGNTIVDFSPHKKAHKYMDADGRSTQTKYEDVDLASGFPAHLIWRTKDGRHIAIPNMTNDHILNTLAMLNRAQKDLSNPRYVHLLKEAHSRGILIEVDPSKFPHPGDLK